MALPAPDLDDRRFQQLVDDAKRMVQARCPTWTDHNVSDPGVTLIETFAYMTDVLLYRLNRVPDRLYLKFLELIGLQLFPATSARTGVTFYLSSPAQATMTLPRGTRAATMRTETEEPVVFTTVEDLPIVACSLSSVLTSGASAEGREARTEQLRLRVPFAAFSGPPVPGDALLVGLTEAVPKCAVRLQFHCTIEGVGVDPDDPPLQWEAYDGTTWHACEVSEDTTGGLNRDGSITVHVPRQHSATLARRRTRRLAACPSDSRRRRAAVVQRLADDPRPHRRHHRWYRRCGPCRCHRTRDLGSVGGRARRDVQDRVRTGAACR